MTVICHPGYYVIQLDHVWNAEFLSRAYQPTRRGVFIDAVHIVRRAALHVVFFFRID